ncbi:hypothetical protein ANASTE_01645 [Anaerofustis stercorihominis DSM 17244]|uniref:Uncharacterized protein n=1 Tax=Anaerofustis stercorihominis DSM 17244 TaxID=445971 RepID=B1C8N1_9FIRM|nr:hypothetical protein ANASTE_01645 [Anaerofustis stercorihominis DSM 17244]
MVRDFVCYFFFTFSNYNGIIGKNKKITIILIKKVNLYYNKKIILHIFI